MTARRSTAVTPEGMQMITRGRANLEPPQALRIKLCSMLAVMSKSAITPSFKGRTATMEPGVRPMTSLASWPTYRTVSVRVSTATTEGSRIMMPFPFIKIKVLAVPRSTPISLENPKFKFIRSRNDMWRESPFHFYSLTLFESHMANSPLTHSL